MSDKGEKQTRKYIDVRKHHLPAVMAQVEKGYADGLGHRGAGIDQGNAYIVNCILGGAKVRVIVDRADGICRGCRRIELKTCDFKD